MRRPSSVPAHDGPLPPTYLLLWCMVPLVNLVPRPFLPPAAADASKVGSLFRSPPRGHAALAAGPAAAHWVRCTPRLGQM